MGIQGAQPSLLPFGRWFRFLAGRPGFARACARVAGLSWMGLQSARLLHASFFPFLRAGVGSCVGPAFLGAGLCLVLLPCGAMESFFSALPGSLWTSCFVEEQNVGSHAHLAMFSISSVLAPAFFAAVCERSDCLGRSLFSAFLTLQCFQYRASWPLHSSPLCVSAVIVLDDCFSLPF